jgi:hypothetical protein
MKAFSIIRLIISAVLGIVIGLVITALINMFRPFTDIAWVITAVGAASILSAAAGYLMGFGRSKRSSEAARGKEPAEPR